MNLSTAWRESAPNFFKRMHDWFAYQLDDQKPKGTIAALDGVRALAAIMVVIYHSSGVVDGHWNILSVPFFSMLNLFWAKGVTLFFILSGFLLFLPYVQALLFEKPWPQARVFYLRRILRIVPGYFFSLFAIILLVKPDYLGIHNWSTLAFFLTFFMTDKQAGAVNPVYWTLAVEFQYYMLLPLIALGIYGLTRLARPKQRFWVVISSLFVMVAWGLVTRAWGSTLFARPDAKTYLASHQIIRVVAFFVYGSSASDTGKFLEVFALGMLLAVCYVVVTNAARGANYRRVLERLSPWLWWIGIALFAFAAERSRGGIFEAYPSWAIEFAFALGFGCWILAILFNGSGILKRIFEWTPLRWIGLISFSLYLWHFLLVRALEWSLAADLFRLFSLPLALGLFAVIECVVVLSVSFTLYVMVEKPGMRLSERLRKKMLTRYEQKEAVPLVTTSFQDREFDPEKTEPRQPVVLGETLHQ
jgi:peptidoglycan/LPS O-acetylase OafA/YrhL